MSLMGEEFNKLTKNDYLEWKELKILDGVDNSYHEYYLVLLKVSTEFNNAGNSRLSLVCLFIAHISSMIYSENKNAPLDALLKRGDYHSFSLDDLTSENLDFLNEIVPETDNYLLKARFADILWIKEKKKNINMAWAAIEFYEKNPVNSDFWEKDNDSIWNRAIAICKQLQTTKEASQHLLAIKDKFKKLFTEEDNSNCYALLCYTEILNKIFINDEEKEIIKNKLNDCADKQISICDYINAHSCFDMMLKLFPKNIVFLNEIHRRIAETYCIEADNSDQPLLSGQLYNSAINHYCCIPRRYRNQWDIDAILDNLRTKMRESNAESLSHMATITFPSIDVTNAIKRAEDDMTGKDKYTALWNLCVGPIYTYDDIRKVTLDIIKRYPVNVRGATTILDDDGRVVARRKGISLEDLDSKSTKESLNQLITNHYRIFCSHDVVANVLPRLNCFHREHQITEKELYYLCYYSNAVPPGRAELWAKGLLFGFNEDFITATHLLSPQIENMVRFELQNKGVKTTTLDNDGVESEIGLSNLLKHEQVSKAVDEVLVFNFQSLMTEPHGANLRNKVAHGLLDNSPGNSCDMTYFWWFCLRLVLVLNRFFVEWKVNQETAHQSKTHSKTTSKNES